MRRGSGCHSSAAQLDENVRVSRESRTGHRRGACDGGGYRGRGKKAENLKRDFTLPRHSLSRNHPAARKRHQISRCFLIILKLDNWILGGRGGGNENLFEENRHRCVYYCRVPPEETGDVSFLVACTRITRG